MDKPLPEELGFREEVWDELFGELWPKLVRSFKKLCYGISDADAEDMAAETLLRLVQYFEYEPLKPLSQDDRRRRLWGYTKPIEIGVRAAFLSERSTECALTVDVEAPAKPAVNTPVPGDDTIARALLQLSADDRRLILLRVDNGWTFRQIQEEFQHRWKRAPSVGALKMRFSRALAELRRSISGKAALR